jgi:hypothetical protein
MIFQLKNPLKNPSKMSKNKHELSSTVSKVTSQIIEINEMHHDKIKQKHADNFLAELALSLANEVDTLRDRLMLLEEQVYIYENIKKF